MSNKRPSPLMENMRIAIRTLGKAGFVTVDQSYRKGVHRSYYMRVGPYPWKLRISAHTSFSREPDVIAGLVVMREWSFEETKARARHAGLVWVEKVRRLQAECNAPIGAQPR